MKEASWTKITAVRLESWKATTSVCRIFFVHVRRPTPIPHFPAPRLFFPSYFSVPLYSVAFRYGQGQMLQRSYTKAEMGKSRQRSDKKRLEKNISDFNMTLVKQACDCCRVRRVKCDGKGPCGRCIQRDLNCTYLQTLRKRGPKSIRSRSPKK